MSNSSEQHAKRDAVEALLESAAPRPRPSVKDEQLVRGAVHAEWQKVTGRRRSQQNVLRFALAASVLIAIGVTFNAFRVTDITPAQVATIGKTHGPVHLLGEHDEYRELADASVAYSGQIILTGDDAGIGLDWGRGGSLRVDQRTRVEFESDATVYLHSGRIYFDSQTPVSEAVLTIKTDHGSVMHVGTQYMAESNGDGLVVSVREGEVEINGHFYDHSASKGKQVRIAGSTRPSVVDLPVYGGAWSWVEAMSPTIVLDGMSTHEFLEWVGRETGHDIAYASEDAESVALRGILKGTVDTDPRNALRVRMMGEDLSYDFDGGTIIVSTKQRR
jgi:ferric-dicitrate binding protein FerR (iron transport regulator)